MPEKLSYAASWRGMSSIYKELTTYIFAIEQDLKFTHAISMLASSIPLKSAEEMRSVLQPNINYLSIDHDKPATLNPHGYLYFDCNGCNYEVGHTKVSNTIPLSRPGPHPLVEWEAEKYTTTSPVYFGSHWKVLSFKTVKEMVMGEKKWHEISPEFITNVKIAEQFEGKGGKISKFTKFRKEKFKFFLEKCNSSKDMKKSLGILFPSIYHVSQ
eukprot:Pgem_evm1s20124